jgi:hypothetical protein
MTMDNGLFSFLYNYRKLLRFLFIFDLVLLPLVVIVEPDTNVTGWITTFIKYGLIPIVGLIYVQKAVKYNRC